MSNDDLMHQEYRELKAHLSRALESLRATQKMFPRFREYLLSNEAEKITEAMIIILDRTIKDIALAEPFREKE